MLTLNDVQTVDCWLTLWALQAAGEYAVQKVVYKMPDVG